MIICTRLLPILLYTRPVSFLIYKLIVKYVIVKKKKPKYLGSVVQWLGILSLKKYDRTKIQTDFGSVNRF